MTSPSLLREDPEPPPDSGQRLWRRVQAVVFILFCLEIGVVLVLFPWSQSWERNYLFSLAPGWSDLFSSGYFRGAISGIGVVNVWIALSEAWRLRSS